MRFIATSLVFIFALAWGHDRQTQGEMWQSHLSFALFFTNLLFLCRPILAVLHLHLRQSTIGRLSTDCWSSLDGMLIKYRSWCQSSTYQDADQEYRLRVWINSQSQMLLGTHDPENLLVPDNWAAFILSPACVVDWTATCKMLIIIIGCIQL